MSQRRDDKRRWGLSIRKLAVALIGLLVLGFLLLQGLLASSWMRNKVAVRLSQRIGGLEVEIDSLSWTPWSGAKIEGFKVNQPASLQGLIGKPLLEVDEIHAWPDYGAALKRKVSASEVTVVRPKLHVTIDMLVSIAASSMAPAEPPAIAAVVPRPGPVRNQPPEEAPSNVDPSLTKSGPAVVEELRPEPAPGPESKVARKRMRFKVLDGSFSLVRAGRTERLVGVEGVNLDVPLFGEAGESVGGVALIEGLGQAIDEEMEIEVKTEGTGVRFHFPGDPSEDFGLFGSCSFGLVAGLPVQVDLGVRLTKVGRTDVSKFLKVECGEVQARVQGGGWLQVPSSWRGLSAFEAKQPLGLVAGQVLGFESASAMLQLAGGVIQSPDFRVMGDLGSILGNGWVTSRDGAAVVRLVVPQSAVGMFNDGLNQRVPGGVFSFKPLSPGNRWLSDVSIWREKAGWAVEFGEGGTVLSLDELANIE